MKKKIFLQLFFFILILIISIIFFKTYFLKDKLKDNPEDLKDDLSIIKTEKSNLIYDLKYVSQDKDKNNYVITSEVGELDDEKPELILMKKVVAIINLKNSTPIKITADQAIYNSINNDTNFYESVLIVYDEHIISSNNLNLLFQKNLATMSENLIYKNLNTKLQADKVEINLITKNTKIYMNNKSKKINIMSIN